MSSPTNPFDQQKPIPGVKHIIAVSAGKGGVGKSTVATNLALALSKKYKVGLLDADIYGPSIPRMMGALGQKPQVTAENRIEPLVRYGMKLMSIGFLIEESAAVVWRGPMLFKAMDQFFRDVNWGELDFLLVDLPPGTGDIQLSLAQKVPVSGAVAVSTPQNIALIDVKKAIDMWKRTGVKMLGVIENMSYLTLPDGTRMEIFGRGGGEKLAALGGVPMLGFIPMDERVRAGGDIGTPIVISDPESTSAKVFAEISEKIAAGLSVAAFNNSEPMTIQIEG